MRDKLLAAVRDYNMLEAGDTVVVGVSGGADSMCLLELLSECAEELRIKIIAAHFNHGIRGKEADNDESFVREYCVKNSIVVLTAGADVPLEANRSGESVEECARRLRYEFLYSVSPNAKIATAHTASDSIETVLMNFSRGSGLNGLCGIPPVRERIIRPLIYFTREDTERCCREHSIEYVIDSTNLCADYTRNAFRLKVIPEIIKINPSFSSNALRCMSIIKEENEYLQNAAYVLLRECTDKDGFLETKKLDGCDTVMLRRVAAIFVASRLKRDVSFKHIQLICAMIRDGGGACELPGGEKLVCKNGRLFFKQPESENAPYLEMKIPENGGIFEFCGRTIDIRFSDKLPNPDKNTFVAAAPEISTLVLRSRREGDKITLSARHCSKTLKKLFCETGIPVEKRNCIPVLADKDGVIFADGFGVNSSRNAMKEEKKYMIIRTEWVNNE